MFRACGGSYCLQEWDELLVDLGVFGDQNVEDEGRFVFGDDAQKGAGDVGDEPAGFFDDKRSGGDVPGLEA